MYVGSSILKITGLHSRIEKNCVIEVLVEELALSCGETRGPVDGIELAGNG